MDNPPRSPGWVEDVMSANRAMTHVDPAAELPQHPALRAPPSPTSDCEMTDNPSLPSTVASSPLFRLPYEIRMQILLPLLSCAPSGIGFPATHLDTSLQPQLLRVNSTLHAELAPLLYGRNRLIFSHPSDANLFRHAMASSAAAAAHARHLVLRVKNTDVQLWTHYFNSLTAERGLAVDFPALRTVGVRFRGPRYAPHLSPEQNVGGWLRDPKMLEIIPAVAKCVEEVFVEICVRVPEGFGPGVFARVVAAGLSALAGGAESEDESILTRKGDYILIMGCWVRLETEGT